jgi:hypothetical protein
LEIKTIAGFCAGQRYRLFFVSDYCHGISVAPGA